jgi:SET domain-containing protein
VNRARCKSSKKEKIIHTTKSVEKHVQAEPRLAQDRRISKGLLLATFGDALTRDSKLSNLIPRTQAAIILANRE